MAIDRSIQQRAVEVELGRADGSVASRFRIVKRITTVGSAVGADVRLAEAPPHWLSLHADGAALVVRELASGRERVATPGRVLDLATPADLPGLAVTLTVCAGDTDPPLAIGRLAAQLAAADSVGEALARLLDAVVEAVGADVGAVVLAERGAFSIAVSRDGDGAPLADAGELLSDTIIADVLAGGPALVADQLGGTAYAQVKSVVRLGLVAAVCLPLRLGDRTLGALFAGTRGRPALVSERRRAELDVVAALALPFVAQLRRPAPGPGRPTGLDGESAPMVELRRKVERVGPSTLSVLLSGPSGAGKEVVARALHAASPRRDAALIAINCAAIAPTLLDSELFGYKKGAFTGAMTDRPGLIELAAGGTLFLDEIGDMPAPMQAALLRVLEQREVRRLGDAEVRPVDFRLVAATHRDLRAEVAAGRFRDDLLFRLQEVTLVVPPLRARGDDVLLLAHTFLRQTEAQLGLAAQVLAPDAVAALRAHAWPGNVRELKAAVRRAAVLSDGVVIHAADLALDGDTEVTPALAAPVPAASGDDLGDTSRPLAEARDAFVLRYTRAALARVGGNRDEAARLLGIGVRTLYRYLESDGQGDERP
ncbi:MAG: sigma-54-dependent Fis family transcriptional regulator [Kofleriaceae bacterium]|nr:sigma-54-dependent Fis family transcriptional regulator [Kofleriaceae bacterium]